MQQLFGLGSTRKKRIGKNETGGSSAAPIWLEFMDAFLDYDDQYAFERQIEEAKAEADRLGIEYEEPEELEPLDFKVPDGVVPQWVDRQSGLLTTTENPNAILEYFLEGTIPDSKKESGNTDTYFDSPEL